MRTDAGRLRTPRCPKRGRAATSMPASAAGSGFAIRCRTIASVSARSASTAASSLRSAASGTSSTASAPRVNDDLPIAPASSLTCEHAVGERDAPDGAGRPRCPARAARAHRSRAAQSRGSIRAQRARRNRSRQRWRSAPAPFRWGRRRAPRARRRHRRRAPQAPSAPGRDPARGPGSRPQAPCRPPLRAASPSQRVRGRPP